MSKIKSRKHTDTHMHHLKLLLTNRSMHLEEKTCKMTADVCLVAWYDNIAQGRPIAPENEQLLRLYADRYVNSY